MFSLGSPAESDAAFLPSFSTNASASDASTTIRSVDMQIWPWLKKAPNAAAFTASSRSASLSTTSGALPPSSSTAGFRCFAASWPTMRPTRVDPVKFTRRTAGLAISRSTIEAASAGALRITLTTPSPSSASCSTLPISRCTAGQISDAFSTTVFPHASGIATARVPSMTGAFHGAMPSTTPHGCRTASAMFPGTSVGMTSPVSCVIIEAASRSIFAASIVLNPYQPLVAPVSRTPTPMKSGARCSIRSAALRSRRLRSVGGRRAQSGNACRAAATAASASSSVAAAARVTTSPVTGLTRSKVAPLPAGRSWPAIKRFVWFIYLPAGHGR